MVFNPFQFLWLFPVIFILYYGLEKVKMQSNCYRYNSTILQLIIEDARPLQKDFKGFRPLYGKILYSVCPTKLNKGNEFDPLKLRFIKLLIDEFKRSGVKLIFAVVPSIAMKMTQF